jgi:hypothetical protein
VLRATDQIAAQLQCSTLAVTLTMFRALKASVQARSVKGYQMKYRAESILVGTGLVAAAVVLTSTCRPLGTHCAGVAVFAVNTPGDKAQTV